MTTPFECYNEYVAVKNHFTQQSYDYFKYQGKTRSKLETFEKRKDKVFFQKMAKHPDLHNFLVANFSLNNKLWIKELAYSDSAEKVYKDWAKRQQSLSYIFKEDLNKLDPEFDKNFIINENEHPVLLQKYLANEISLETICILIDLTQCQNHWDKKMKYDLVWDSVRNNLVKYTPFISYDKEKIKKIILDFF